MRSNGSPEWQRAALVPIFTVFYVALAPLVGAFADALPKGKVMFISNAIKVVGCVMMLFGTHPLLAYAIVGLGAAAYSPAKYGILTELLPASQLVKANGWIEGLTIASIIWGSCWAANWWAMRVEPLAGVRLSLHRHRRQHSAPGGDRDADPGLCGGRLVQHPHPLHRSVRCIRAAGEHGCAGSRLLHCNSRLWRDKLGQISLATTTLFWGAGGNLEYIVLPGPRLALGYNTAQASSLTGVVAIGTAVGAIVASVRMRLDMATRVIPMGIGMGVLVIGMNFIGNIWLAVPFLILLGGLGGFLVVPMNALLQHRGHNLMGSGRSIAVQNFNEQACILVLGAFYSACTGIGMSAYSAITAFGVVVAGFMWLIKRWHQSNLRKYPEEVEHLLAIARSDKHH